MSDDGEHKVRERAYRIWQQEGEPHGKDVEHWHRARSEAEPTGNAQAKPEAARPDDDPPAIDPMASPAKRKRERARSGAAMQGSKPGSGGAGQQPAAKHDELGESRASNDEPGRS